MAKPIDPEQTAFIRVPVKTIPLIIEALAAGGFVAAAVEVNRFTRSYTDPDANEDREAWVDHANSSTDGRIEFDSDSIRAFSSDMHGDYVLGWVWVDNPSSISKEEVSDAEGEEAVVPVVSTDAD